jgi:hypothetical protein
MWQLVETPGVLRYEQYSDWPYVDTMGQQLIRNLGMRCEWMAIAHTACPQSMTPNETATNTRCVSEICGLFPGHPLPFSVGRSSVVHGRWSIPKYRPPDAYQRRTFLDRDLEIVGHTHR